MGKDSEFYKDKKRKQKMRLRELISRLPSFASDYIYSKEVTTQTSTLVSYCYDLITFFEFLCEQNPVLKGKKTNTVTLDDLAKLDGYSAKILRTAKEALKADGTIYYKSEGFSQGKVWFIYLSDT